MSLTSYKCVAAVMAPGKNSRLYMPGERLPADFPEDIAKQHVESGYVEEVTNSGLVLAKEAPPVVMKGKWIFDPAELRKKSIKALNTMIAERDPSVAPYADKTEAINHLSQDFRR